MRSRRGDGRSSASLLSFVGVLGLVSGCARAPTRLGNASSIRLPTPRWPTLTSPTRVVDVVYVGAGPREVTRGARRVVVALLYVRAAHMSQLCAVGEADDARVVLEDIGGAHADLFQCEALRVDGEGDMNGDGATDFEFAFQAPNQRDGQLVWQDVILLSQPDGFYCHAPLLGLNAGQEHAKDLPAWAHSEVLRLGPQVLECAKR